MNSLDVDYTPPSLEFSYKLITSMSAEKQILLIKEMVLYC